MKREVAFPSDGETLRGDLHVPDGRAARATLVLNHGLASERREFAEAPEKLALRGWAVLAFDRRGHGASTGERGRLSREWAVADLRAALAYLKSEPLAPAPYGLVGHSLGAAFATAALAELTDFTAGALVAPLCRTLDEIGALEFQGYKAAKQFHELRLRLGLGPLVVPYKNDYPKLFRDPQAVKRAKAAGFLHRTISISNYDELMGVDASEWAKRVKQPTLVVIAEHDRAVQHASSRKVFDALAGPKKLRLLEGSGHSAFGDHKQDELVAMLDEWFGRELAG